MRNRGWSYLAGAVIIACVPCLCVFAAEVRVVRAADYGAISNDGLDDTSAVNAALKACKGAPSRLVFDPGQYDTTAKK